MFLAVCGALATTLAGSVPQEVQVQFNSWKRTHGVRYTTQEEHTLRLAQFHENLVRITHLNAASAGGATFAANKFADRSPTELAKLRGFRGKEGLSMRAAGEVPEARRLAAAPASWDWRTQPNVVPPIQDQGQCGSCWAFSATVNLESRLALKTGTLTKFAEQGLVDCDHVCGNYDRNGGTNGCDAGCNGGLMPNAFQYAMASGMALESAYPYTAADGTCQNYTRQGKWSGWEFVSTDEDQMAAYLAANGPVSIAVDAANWSFYEGGIMQSWFICGNPLFPDSSLDHGVALVGYGTDAGVKYWIVRNSWGTSWGENGYARLIFGTGYCGLNLFACSAKI